MRPNRSFDTASPRLSRLAGLGLAVLTFTPALAMAAGTVNTTSVVTGSTITAANCSIDAVRAAVNAAESMNQAGLTVAIPAGTCGWGKEELTLPGRIALKGAGREVTIIKRTAAVTGVVFLVRFNCHMYKNAKLSDMTLLGSSPNLSLDRGLGLVGTCVDFRGNNSKYAQFSSAGIEVRGGPATSGVIYSNQFINNYVPGINLGYGVVVYGQEWPELKLGIEKAPGHASFCGICREQLNGGKPPPYCLK